MKLISIELRNFRQFYGDQAILFAGEPGRNVTVIHGHNGAGKTALLNAFVWCLYGETTPDLDYPDQLDNERASAEAAVGDLIEVKVLLTYEGLDGVYIVERSRKSEKGSSGALRYGDVELRMWRKAPGGELATFGAHHKERQLRINQLLPPSLYPFFFFNGERVEKLAGDDAYERVEGGIKTLLNVAIFERSVNHLRKLVVPELSRELKNFSDDDLRQTLEEQEEKQAMLDKAGADHNEAREQIRALHAEIEEFERKQASVATLAQLTERRAGLRDQLQRIDQTEADVNASLRRLLSGDGFLAFAADVFVATEDLVSGARARREIPAKIKPQFVDDLLAELLCICGRPIQHGGAEWDALLRWKEKTGLADLEETISATAARIDPMRQRAERFVQEVTRLQKARSESLADRRGIQRDLAIVEQEIGDGSSDEDAAALASRLVSLRRDLTQRQAVALVAEREMKDIEEVLRELRAHLKRLEAHNERAVLLKRQVESVGRVADALDSVFQVQKNAVRRILDEKISQIWRDAAIKDYSASVTEDYNLILTKRVGGREQRVYGASTGEKQVLAVSFVASLVSALKTAADDPESGKALGLVLGGAFPLVMDSPFGSLEGDYRQKVAEWVPRLAEQIVVMVSTSQWREEAEHALSPKIGREYVLELHTAKINASRSIELRERNYPYVVSSSEPFEFTKIEEVV